MDSFLPGPNWSMYRAGGNAKDRGSAGKVLPLFNKVVQRTDINTRFSYALIYILTNAEHRNLEKVELMTKNAGILTL